MNEHFINLPFKERVRLTRNELNKAEPLLDKLDEKGVLDDIIAKWGLNSNFGYDALLQPLADKIAQKGAIIEEQLQSPYLLPQRIKRDISNWLKEKKEKK